jgi:hypothetical protein
VAPLNTDLVSRLYVNDFCGHWCAVAGVAGHVLVVDVLDWVVLLRLAY